ncbi:MAG: hypothetical protein JF606_06555 [Burkholderiales bacterium]|nr:hypothetical protein [Burkholderiales bacterium]
MTLDLLNEATQAWVEQEYHRTVHTELKVRPLARYLAGPSVARKCMCPDSAMLRDAFRIEVARRAPALTARSAWASHRARCRAGSRWPPGPRCYDPM